MKLALFDFDHTLLDGDTNVLWIEHLVQNGLVGPDVAALQAEYLAQYGREQLDMAEYMGFHIRLLSQRTLSQWQPVLHDFAHRRIAPRLAPEGLQTLQAHREAGERVVLVTATNSVLIGAVGQLLRMETVASDVEVVNDRITGRTLGLPAFREHKITRTEALLGCALNSTHITESCFYSDSANDIPLLQAVTHPHAVNPDAKLRALAQAQAWPLHSWKVPEPAASATAPI